MKQFLTSSHYILAQIAGGPDIQSFKAFLAKILLLVGVIIVAYGGWQIAHGRQSEGLLCLVGGLLMAMAIPLITFFASLYGISF